jgi:flavin reductase (DIM6/NTAB) family NADH-FMN oxidoreductase RutF
MLLTKGDLEHLPHIQRLNLINSITGIKPANLVGTCSVTGQTNLAIFSSVLHLGSNPALLAFVLRPADEVIRHTYENLRATGFYSINQVGGEVVEKAHQTSARYPAGVSEFAACGFTEVYLNGFPAPFVQESRLQIGMAFRQELPIEANGTRLIIGEVVQLCFPQEAMDKEGHLDLEALGAAGIAGLDSYYAVKKLAQFERARP